ncbi:hypothetical protein C7402_11910 [Paraburkholderia unamae]|uniref:Uncharacterized protein n=2 Tax=Paraburkholderia unamae TaxID=219649 RepID=A0ABX5KCS0_9BURK|nr:hypothetical protein C7402_11910 [Paraburkholderia unamae]RAR56963.1 hypothetical protein C7401_117151 [Paraburkholderia unamae]CAG9263610.1 conserved hypothetical protein [Paraburkholderia unamae]
MDTTRPLPAGYMMSNLIDQDIAHIRRVMPLSLAGDFGGPILAASYWRQRLHRLLDTGLVNKGQLSEIDSLLLILDLHDLNVASAAAAAGKQANATPQRS